MKRLNRIYKSKCNNEEKAYLKEVITLFESNSYLLIMDPVEISSLTSTISNPPTKSIKDKIIKALGYSNLRSSFYPKYFAKIGIKSCVYCNSQLTVSVQKPNGKYAAKFDVDHNYSKDEYPYLSISLFNLYPSCASCNRIKNNSSNLFELYSNDSNKVTESDVKFKLDAYSKASYLLTKDVESINISVSGGLGSTLDSKFHLKGIYDTQKDVVEELIIKSQMYNPTYLKSLRDNFSKLSLHPELFMRTIVGNYTKDKDIHKRPLSKFTMDIAKELGLIKD